MAPPAYRNNNQKDLNGKLPSLDSLREEDLSKLSESLVSSKERRKEIWKEEMKQMNKVPEKGKDGSSEGDGDDDGDGDGDNSNSKNNDKDIITEPMLPLTGLKAILAYSVSPKSTSSQRSQSGTSTPSRSTQQQSGGSRTPMDDMISVQMIYQAAFIFWLYSFDDEIAAELNNKFDIISVLADVARNAVKEKVVRVIVATFRNLGEKAPNANISAMLGCKCLPLMESLSGRKWSDEEITQDIDAVKDLLSEKLKGMSKYDEFVSELSSGRLTWDNPAHSLDEFWKENTSKLLEGAANDDHSDESGLTMLINLLSKEDLESTTLAIACNDIGKIITFSPESGKKQVEKQGGKAKVMQLMTHSDGEVKFYALNTVSRLMSASWRG